MTARKFWRTLGHVPFAARAITGFPCLAILPLILPVGTGYAATGVWTADTNGNWSDTNRWASGIVAEGAGNTADFSTLNISANRTVTLDSACTMGAHDAETTCPRPHRER